MEPEQKKMHTGTEPRLFARVFLTVHVSLCLDVIIYLRDSRQQQRADLPPLPRRLARVEKWNIWA